MRRLAFAAAALATLMLGSGAGLAQPRHGWSIFGELKYPSGFDHFDYVNPDAPKGGRIATIGTSSVNTFDSLNGYILRGDPAQRLDLLFDSLMVRATDEPDAMYGLVASTIDVADDKSYAIFALRPEARFADGTPLDRRRRVSRLSGCSRSTAMRTSAPRSATSAAARPSTSTPCKYTLTGSNRRDLPGIIGAAADILQGLLPDP